MRNTVFHRRWRRCPDSSASARARSGRPGTTGRNTASSESIISSSKDNDSQNGLDIDLSTLAKNKYSLVGEKLSLPSTKGSESVSLKNNKCNNNYHKKIFKKNINNINIIEYNNHHDIIDNSNYNINNFSNTISNRGNINKQNNRINNNNKNNSNIRKSISLVSMDKPSIYNTQTYNRNKTNLNLNKNIINNNEFYSNDNSHSIHKKITFHCVQQ